jgi:putative NADH-flavin reductase
MTRALIFGASGATGKQIVAAALEKGWQVTAFARQPMTITGVKVIRGDVVDGEAVAAAIAGHDVIISALGVSTPLHTDPAVVQGIENIIAGMQAHGVRRLMYLSFVGVTESRSAAGWFVAHVARHPLRHEIADHERKEALIKASPLDWTIVRPPKLTNGPRTGRYRSGEKIAANAFFPRLARADVAEFMVERVADLSCHRRPIILMPAS